MNESSPKPTQYIFFTGGVISSLGKGIAAASMANLLKARGYRVALQKFDPYINVDPGTMNPFQHGEVYVTEDGAETDLDLGHYERFTAIPTTRLNNVTAGQIYNTVISRERRGEYLGETVQVIPHVTDEIKNRIKQLGKSSNADICIVEIGGTVGDIESLPFLEAIRQFRQDVGRENVLYVHLTLVPYQETAGELKTKPTQHSVKALREIGIQPDIILCRSAKPLDDKIKAKIALFCDTPKESVISLPDVSSIYRVPLVLREGRAERIVLEKLGRELREGDSSAWDQMVSVVENPERECTIAIVGKYTGLKDAYKSIAEALIHAGILHKARINTRWVEAEDFTSNEELEAALEGVDGVIVPGGFGVRGIEGKLKAIQFVRERRVPFFGICLGLQCAVIEIARNMAGLKGANSQEFDEKCRYPVIHFMQDQRDLSEKGGTMRLGHYPCRIRENTLAHLVYQSTEILERHRHRLEVNNGYRDRLAEVGLVFSGLSPDGLLVEMVELTDHPYFIACQFHPEFQSNPTHPHPLFAGLVEAALRCRDGQYCLNLKNS